MAVIDTFYLLFEADASKLRSGMKEAEKTAKDVKQELTGVEKTANMVGHNMTRMVKNMARLWLGTRAISMLKGITLETMEHNVALGKQAAALDMNVEKMQEFHDAFEAAGSSAQVFDNVVKKLGDSVKDPEERIKRLADTMMRMGDKQRADYGKSLGLDPEAIALLSQGRRGLDEYLRKEKELGVVKKEDIERSKIANEEMRKATRLWEDLKNRLSIGLMPVLTWALKKFQEFMKDLREHPAFYKSLFSGMAAGIGVMFLPVLKKALGVVLRFAAPFLKVAAIVTLISLLVDDLLTYFRGGDSVIGDIAEKFPFIKSILEGIKSVVEWIGDQIRKIFPDVENFGDGMATILTIVAMIILKVFSLKHAIFLAKLVAFELKMAWGAVRLATVAARVACEKLPGVIGGASKAVGGLTGAMSKLGTAAGLVGAAMLGWEIGSWLNEQINGVITKLTGKENSVLTALAEIRGSKEEDKILAEMNESDADRARKKAESKAWSEEYMKGVREKLAQANAAPNVTTASIQNSSKNVSRNTNVKIDKVEVVTQEANAEGIAQGAATALQNEMKKANQQASDGVAI